MCSILVDDTVDVAPHTLALYIEKFFDWPSFNLLIYQLIEGSSLLSGLELTNLLGLLTKSRNGMLLKRKALVLTWSCYSMPIFNHNIKAK